MPRIELTIKTDYLPNWGVSEGIRELVSNGRDAEVEYNAPVKIDWYNNTLRIANDGCILPREALLLGHTTKLGSSATVGKFGEGLKLGILALLRAGSPVRIRSGSEVWVPAIERSDKFSADVLVFNIAEGRKPENRVRVEIGNVSQDDWFQMRERFLFLTEKTTKIKKVSTPYGHLLMDPAYAGKIFIKGVFVQHSPDHTFGYDIPNLELDRDRKMVDSYSLRSYINGIWKIALQNQPDLMEQYFGLLLESKGEAAGVSQFTASSFPAEVLTAVAARFTTIYGDDAFPVQSLEQSHELEHLGKRGIVLSPSLLAILAPTMGSLDDLKVALKREIKQSYSWSDLTEEEKMNLLYACDLLEGVDSKFNAGIVDVVDFRSPTLDGLYSEERLQIARPQLGDRCKLLQTLIHEYAHHLSKSSDGMKDHVMTIEDLWMKVAVKLWKS